MWIGSNMSGGLPSGSLGKTLSLIHYSPYLFGTQLLEIAAFVNIPTRECNVNAKKKKKGEVAHDG